MHGEEFDKIIILYWNAYERISSRNKQKTLT